MPFSPVEERDSRCTKLLFELIPIAKSGLPAFFITSAAGVPSVVLCPSVIKTVSTMNSYNTISKPPLARHNHRRCTEIHKKCYFIPSYVNRKYHQTSLCGFFSRLARDETTDDCKMTAKSKCASIGHWTFCAVIMQLIKSLILLSSY